jgi:acetate kinase
VNSEIAEFLSSKVSLFSNFPPDRVQKLVEGSRVITCEQHEAIIQFGDEGHFMGVMLDGSANVSYTDDHGEEHTLGEMKSGDIFGEISLMTGDKTTADVHATVRCKVLVIPQTLFLSQIVTFPPAVMHLSRMVSERLKNTYSERGRAIAASAFKRSDDPYGFGLRTEFPARFLAVNCGSSSIKYCLFDSVDKNRNIRGIVERIGIDGTRNKWSSLLGDLSEELPTAGHKEAFEAMFETIQAGQPGALDEITAVGHRVVHGGEHFTHSTVVNENVIKEIEDVSELAPLHNPVNLMGIREAMKHLPGVPHVAVFDTAFHHTIPPYAHLYALPTEYYEKRKIRRYGFHGLSHGYVSLRAAQFLKRPFNALKIISCHLGNGASVCAIDHGRSIDTSMGLTPTEGLVMGTRCGDIDPSVLFHLMKTENLTAEQLHEIIDKKSGLKGLSGISSDMREIEQAALQGENWPLLAFKTFCYKIRKYIGSYVAAMGGMDVLIFTGGIGQGSWGIRSLACQGLSCMGIKVSEEDNRGAQGFESICDISEDGSPVRVLVVPTDEELMIARETLRTLDRHQLTRIVRSTDKAPVPIEVSAHHVHLAPEHIEALFGPGTELSPEVNLSQPGQFAYTEKVNLIGPKGRVDRVRILGPPRKETQVEISMTEQFILGLQPPVRQSGDLEGSPGITMEGPNGTVAIDKGVICALRHVHMSPEDALRYGLRDKCLVKVRTVGGLSLVFGDVLIRVNPNYRLAMHIDTDEANAAKISTGMTGYIDEIQSKS